LSFLQELRKDPKGKHLILTAATPITPFANQKGDPSVNMSGFSKVLDFISIMNYDVWGPWSQTVGPNTPLNDTCAVADNQVGSAVSAVQLWNKAGMPMNQMVLGVPSYGHAYRVPRKNAFRAGSTTVLASYPAFNRTGIPPGDSWSDPAGTDVCGAAQPAGGTIDFWSLIEQGYLNIKGTPRKGIAYLFDICSQTVSK
jgi:chitinase